MKPDAGVTGFHLRPIAGEPDLGPIAVLINAASAADGLTDRVAIDSLRRDLVEPEPGWLKDGAVWETAGRIVAFSCLFASTEGEDERENFCWFEIDPMARTDSLGDSVVTWSVEAIRRLAGDRVTLRADTADGAVWRRALLERHGFQPVRYFQRLRRDLGQPIAPEPLPLGYTIRPVNGPEDVAAWVECFNNSFIDHWNHIPETVGHRQFDMESPGYLPELDLMAVAPDGVIAAFVHGQREEEDDGKVQWWVRLLGTARGYRRQSLGRAMLSICLQRMQDRGASEAFIGVDADSPTGATRLYETAGFTIAYRSTAMVKQIG